jgi:hypothetical protein
MAIREITRNLGQLIAICVSAIEMTQISHQRSEFAARTTGVNRFAVSRASLGAAVAVDHPFGI